MKYINLTQGQSTMVDDEDFEYLNQWGWFAQRDAYTLYACRYLPSKENKGKKTRTLLRLHRVIMDAPKGAVVDHIDGNGLNNQRSNLRVCSLSQNQRNSRKQCNNTSGYKGVSWHKGRRMWQAQIVVNNKKVYLGAYDYVTDAALAYNAGAIKYFGEFARLNIVVDVRLK